MTTWQMLNQQIAACESCPRLRDYCQQIGKEKRRAFQDWDYWSKPVPNFGDAKAKLLIVGLAPAAHGANRTGRMFTGDRSGDWLYRALHRAGFASQPTAASAHDGLQLQNAAITAICHCAPPANKPLPVERDACRQWLIPTLDLLAPQVFLALGKIAWDGIWIELKQRFSVQGARPAFAHGAEVPLDDNHWLLGSYHPSQQNTFTGKLTEPMLDAVFQQAKQRLQH